MTPARRPREGDPSHATADATYVEVALPLPLFRNFTYRHEGPGLRPGTRVLVPFQRVERVGWVVGPGDPEGVSGIRSVLAVLDDDPSIPPDLLALGRWISEYYVSPLGVTLRSLLPSVLSGGGREVVRLTAEGARRASEAAGSGKRPRERGDLLLSWLAERHGEAALSTLRRDPRWRSPWKEVARLAAAGLVERAVVPPKEPAVRTRRSVRITRWLTDLAEREEIFGRAHRQRECYELLESAGGAVDLEEVLRGAEFSRPVVSGLVTRGLAVIEEVEDPRDPFGGEEPAPPPPLVPTPAQARAIGELTGAAGESAPRPFVLHGVTGSGKTLVYARLLEEVVGKLGRSAIVLVPEIALTPQTVSRFRGWFGDQVAVLHSALSPGERFEQWRGIRRGEKRVVIGARSALFAPVPRLGAIIVDEEHDSSYKQSEAPRYHARDAAVVRARSAGAICVLGSATPALESWANVWSEKFRLLTLPERVEGRPLPPIEVVDLRRVRGFDAVPPQGKGRGSGHGVGREEGGVAGRVQGRTEGILSPRLVLAVEERLRRGEQSILLLNRRGFASLIQCRACGAVLECPNCSVSLTHHRASSRLLCHHCRHEEPVPVRCRGCGAQELGFLGSGTQRVEQAVAEAFPLARIARMDVDTTSGRWAHHQILGRVERGEVDILLGTQMIAKGLDFPRVTLVGIINADVGIHLPDFRASERTFQLLCQVAGRTGRGGLGGEVVLQSSLPDHYVIQTAVRHDVAGFVERELAERKAPPYPPHVRMANVVLSSPDRALVADGAEKAAAWARERIRELGARGAQVVGPAPSPIERLHGRWRWHFFVRGGGVGAVTLLLRGLLESFEPPAGDLRVVVDRDPVALL